MSFGASRRKNEITMRGGVASRLAEHAFPQIVRVVAKVDHLFEHRSTWDIEYTAHDHAAMLSTRMSIYS